MCETPDVEALQRACQHAQRLYAGGSEEGIFDNREGSGVLKQTTYEMRYEGFSTA